MAGTGAPIKVLAVDDDPAILRLIEVNLSLEGFEVAVAAGGDDAVARAKEVDPDVILLDVMMPGLTGWDLARRLRDEAATTAIPLVFLSARTQDEDRRRGEELGVAAYVNKPFDPADLVGTIRRVAGRA